MNSLTNYLPQLYMASDADGSLAAFVNTFDTAHEQLIEAIESLPLVNQPRNAPLAFLNNLATHYGNPFPFMTAERWQEGNKLENLIYLYSLRGTAPGVTSAIRYLCGIEVTVRQDFQICWQLGISQLGSLA